MPQGDEDDSRFDPTNFDEEPEEMLGWDANADVVSQGSCSIRPSVMPLPTSHHRSVKVSTEVHKVYHLRKDFLK